MRYLTQSHCRCYYADNVNAISKTLARLGKAWREVGRDPATLQRTGFTIISFAERRSDLSGYRTRMNAKQKLMGTPEEVTEKLHAFHIARLQHLNAKQKLHHRSERQAVTTHPVFSVAS